MTAEGLRDYSYPSLFTWGEFTAASGRTLGWKIDCDFLTLDDWRTLARVVAPRIPAMREVISIPTGGDQFARCLIEAGVLAAEGDREGRPRLIVDDVWTTGSSVAKVYEPGDFVVVAFARGPSPIYVTAVWQLEEGFSDD